MKSYIQTNYVIFLSALFLTLSIHSGITSSRPVETTATGSSRVRPETFETDGIFTYQTLKNMIKANIQTLHDCEQNIMLGIKHAEESGYELTKEDKKVYALDGINRQVSCINLILENLKQKRNSLSLEDRRRNEIIILLDWAKTFFKAKKEKLQSLQSDYGIWPEPILTSPRRNSV